MFAGIERTGLIVPYRTVVSKELAKLHSVLSHPIRVRIIEELRGGELSVNALRDRLGITHAAVSQQLAVLRSSRLIVEQRQGRNVFYQLRNPELASWIMDGVKFISPDPSEVEQMLSAIQNAKGVWTASHDKPTQT